MILCFAAPIQAQSSGQLPLPALPWGLLHPTGEGRILKQPLQQQSLQPALNWPCKASLKFGLHKCTPPLVWAPVQDTSFCPVVACHHFTQDSQGSNMDFMKRDSEQSISGVLTKEQAWDNTEIFIKYPSHRNTDKCGEKKQCWLIQLSFLLQCSETLLEEEQTPKFHGIFSSWECWYFCISF